MLALVVADFKGFVELSIFRCISSFFGLITPAFSCFVTSSS